MFFYSLASLIPLTVLLVLVVVSVRAIWLAIVPPRLCVKEASCEKCKYPVAGLSAWTCPECGSHLLTVGIVTRSMEMRRRGSYVAAISGMFFLLLVIAITGIIIAFATIGDAASAAFYSREVHTTTIAETMGVLPPIELTFEYEAMAGSSEFRIKLVGRPQAGVLVVDASETSGYRRLNAADETQSEGVFDADAIKQWLSDAEVDPSQSAIDNAVEELHNYLTTGNASLPSSADLPSFAVGNPTYATLAARGHEDAYRTFTLIIWGIPISAFLLWVLLSLLVVRRRRKLLRDADAPPAAQQPSSDRSPA